MRRLSIVVTNACNINCSYCFNTTHDTVVQRRSEQNGLKLDTIREVTKELSELDYDSVTLTGGEPTFSSQGPIWIECLGKARLPTILITNLVRMSPDLEELIAAHDSILVRVSMGGGSAETHNVDRAMFKETEANLRKLARRGVHCEVSMVITPANLNKIPEFETFCRDVGCIGSLVPVSGNQGNLLAAIHESKWEDIVARLDDSRLQHNLLLAHAYLSGITAPARCALRTQSHVLTTDGDLVGCFFREDVVFGNVEREPAGVVLRRAWSDEVLPASCFGNHCIGIHLH